MATSRSRRSDNAMANAPIQTAGVRCVRTIALILSVTDPKV
jgi:hypothetical protein